ncbi:MAG: hypothetical protein ABWZ76_01885 [Acidimicrobiales bacterium]
MPELERTAREEGAADLRIVASRRRRFLVASAVLAVVALAVAFAVERRSSGSSDPPPGSWTIVPYEGLGAWVDVYDWTDEFTAGAPPVGLADIEAMADQGIQTLFLQTGHSRSASDVLETERLTAIVDEAHKHDMHVVAWYLPTLVDLDEDLRRLTRAAELPVDGLSVDIEAIDVTDPAERTLRLLQLTEQLRTAVGADKVLGAITLTAVHLEVLNPDYWPGYPWAELGAAYDAVLPMAYWSIRTGELRSGDRYIGENIDRIRVLVGAEVPVHGIGGIADAVTVEDLDGMVAALMERGAIGGSLYDWNTARPEQWRALRSLRELRTEPEG